MPDGTPPPAGNVGDAAAADNKIPDPSNWKANVGNFSGNNDDDIGNVIKFIKRLEGVKTIKNWNDAAIINAFSLCLTDYAYIWFDNTLLRHPNDVTRWPRVKELFYKEFRKTATTQERTKVMSELTQRHTESARKFANRVDYTLAKLVELDADPNQTADFIRGQKAALDDNIKYVFVNGLKKAIKEKVEGQPGLDTLDELIDAAEHAERATGGVKMSVSAMEEKNDTRVDELKLQIDALNKRIKAMSTRGGRGNRRVQGGCYQRRAQYRGYGRGQPRGGRGALQPQTKRIFCYRCRQYAYHKADTCPVTREQMAYMEEMDPNMPPPDEYENDEYQYGQSNYNNPLNE